MVPKATINPVGGGERLSEAFRPGESQVPETSSPPTERVFSAPYQSATDGTLVYQPPGELIVAATEFEDGAQTAGYSAMWSPDADCPIAVRFRAGAQKSPSKPLIVLPGQVIRPHGLPRSMERGSFSGLDVGLPFGWLGGGNGRLLIFKTEDAVVRSAQAEPREVLFHVTRLTIAAAFNAIPNWPANPLVPGTASAAWNAVPWVLTNSPQWAGGNGTPVPNWPTRFPWRNAYGSDATTGQTQLPMGGRPDGQPGGEPRLSVRPTRVVLTLQTPNVPAAMGSGAVTAYVVPPSNIANAQRTYPAVQYLTFNAGDANGFSSIEVKDGPLLTMGGDDAAVGLLSAEAAMQGVNVSVFRYGVLG